MLIVERYRLDGRYRGGEREDVNLLRILVDEGGRKKEENWEGLKSRLYTTKSMIHCSGYREGGAEREALGRGLSNAATRDGEHMKQRKTWQTFFSNAFLVFYESRVNLTELKDFKIRASGLLIWAQHSHILLKSDAHFRFRHNIPRCRRAPYSHCCHNEHDF